MMYIGNVLYVHIFGLRKWDHGGLRAKLTLDHDPNQELSFNCHKMLTHIVAHVGEASDDELQCNIMDSVKAGKRS